MPAIARRLTDAGRDPAARRNIAILAGAVAGHALVFAVLAMRVIEPPAMTAAPPPLFLDIEPRPLMPDERPRTPRVPAPAQVRVDPGGASASAPAIAPRLREDEEDEAADAPTAADQGVDPLWRVRPETASARAAQAIRAAGFGCHPPGRTLTAAEQASCDRRLAEAGGAPIAGTGDAARDRRFAREGAAELRRYEAQRAPQGTAVGVVGPADCVGSNLGTGCAGAHQRPVPGVDMRQGADSLTRLPSNKLD